MECQYCKTILKTNSALKQHQTKTKYCLKLQGKDNEKGTFICKGCNKDFHQKSNLTIHIKTCGFCKTENLLKRIEILEKDKKDLIQDKKDLIQTLAKNTRKTTNIHNIW